MKIEIRLALKGAFSLRTFDNSEETHFESLEKRDRFLSVVLLKMGDV